MSAKATLLTPDHIQDIKDIITVVSKNPNLVNQLIITPTTVTNTAPADGYVIPVADFVTYVLRKKMFEFGINVSGACDNPDGSPRTANAVMTELRRRFDAFISI